MKKIRYISFLFFFIASLTLFAQEEINQNEVNRDDLGDVSDQFQELFLRLSLKKRLRILKKQFLL